MFVMAEESFEIWFKDESCYKGGTKEKSKLIELEDRLVVEEGDTRRVFFNSSVESYNVTKKELDTTGLDLEIKI